MVKTYRSVQQWDHWLTHFLGTSILESEQAFLSTVLAQHYGKHALLVGVPCQHVLFKSILISNHMVLSPLINKNKHIKYIESGYYELPIIPGSIDLVIVPHTLELIDNPRQLLNEACRVVKPEGNIIIFGFNPYSFWGLKKWWVKSKNTPWSGNFIHPAIVKRWLTLADFELIRQDMMMFRPPIHRQSVYEKLKGMEWMGSRCNAFFGGIYAITAKAKVIPLTPIKLRWKQQLKTLSVPLPGSTMRDMQ